MIHDHVGHIEAKKMANIAIQKVDQNEVFTTYRFRLKSSRSERDHLFQKVGFPKDGNKKKKDLFYIKDAFSIERISRKKTFVDGIPKVLLPVGLRNGEAFNET